MKTDGTGRGKYAGIHGPLTRQDATNLQAYSGELFHDSTPTDIATEVGKLFAVMPLRDRSERDLKVLTAAYIEDLSEFPIDIVREVFKRWRRTEKWFPRISELRAEAWRVGERRMIWKAAILDALSKSE